MNYIYKWLNLQKEGILFGLIIAIVILFSNTSLLSFLQLPEEPIWKYSIVIYICTSAGAILDAVIKPNK